jgi:arabinogalactan oligomer/maltooligosaccharide transport system permease protein
MTDATMHQAQSAVDAAAGAASRAMGPRLRRWFRSLGWRHLVAWAALAFAIFPALWTVSASFNPLGSLTSQKLIPDDLS